MPSFNEITPVQLMRQIGGPDTPVILDVCLDEDFSQDPRLIPTSRRVKFDHVLETLPLAQGQRVVVACQKGKKLSHGAAALLRSKGVDAEVLEGGVFAWSDAGLPYVPAANLPTASPSVWVTRHRPKIDRIACPWLIRRFLDPSAQILFVPPSEVAQVAERFDAIAFDIEGAKFAHQGTHCSFDAFIKEFALSHPALDRLAEVVRAADNGTPQNAPQAAGLLAISVGFSRLYKSDNDQLEAALPIYDALYRWARDGFEETHAHSTGKPS